MEESASKTPSVTEGRGFPKASLPKPHEHVECFRRDQGSGERAWVQAVVILLDLRLTPPSVFVKVGSDGRKVETELDHVSKIASPDPEHYWSILVFRVSLLAFGFSRFRLETACFRL